MPVLSNARHERFALMRVEGHAVETAYVMAGFRAHSSNAHRLAAREDVCARILELMERAANKAVVTREQIMRELAKIAFADIRKAIRWKTRSGSLAQTVDSGESSPPAQSEIVLVDSEKLDDDTAAAISEISQNLNGGMRIKFHDKRAALELLGRDLGMFKDDSANQTNIIYTVSDTPPTAEEWAAEYTTDKKPH